ncbi:MAG TPA: cation/H(+) antiporter [Micromonosporaceae bacterium]|nr:cation/H(+) antiporter [Micromonosporaceae bacterium]HCU50796.1 cation/H(+) antiporter [Micromonosporaceae bacterium]
MPALSHVAMQFFLQMFVILAVYRLLWPVFRRLGQVQVVAIMVTGFLLGPSLLGLLAPSVQEWLFPQKVAIGGQSVTHPSLVALYITGQLGLVLYMFLVGTAFNTSIFANHIRHAAVVSFAGIGAPMLLGGVVGWIMVRNGNFFTDKVAGWQGALFLAAAIAITAFPMLAWIVYDSGLLHTRVGTMALACAAADDAAAWILLAGVVAATKGSASIALLAIAGTIFYLVLMLTVGKRLLRRMGDYADTRMARGEGLPIGALVGAMMVLLVGAWFTDLVGVYAVFGAFLAGVVMPRGQLITVLRERLEPLTAYLLLPAFFVYSGLNTRLTLLFDPTVLVMLVIVLIISFAGKGLSVAAAARAQGMGWREAGSLGALMNARGLMELILLNIGLNAGIVTPQLYTILAVMAIVTTFAATPLHNWIQKRRPATPDTPVAPKAVAVATAETG